MHGRPCGRPVTASPGFRTRRWRKPPGPGDGSCQKRAFSWWRGNMAKSGKKPKTARWTDELDKDEVDEALENATVDAHDEYERHTGLLTAIQDELAFPFQVQVLG